MPVFDEYAVKTAGVRRIPVFTLERVTTAARSSEGST